MYCPAPLLVRFLCWTDPSADGSQVVIGVGHRDAFGGSALASRGESNLAGVEGLL